MPTSRTSWSISARRNSPGKRDRNKGRALRRQESARPTPRPPVFSAPAPAPGQPAPQQQAGLIFQTEHYQGVLPHPAHLREFEQIVPGSARELLDMAKRQARHRHFVEKLSALGEFGQRVLGPFMATAVFAVGLYFAARWVERGNDLAGLTAFVATLAPMIVAFLGRRKQPKGRGQQMEMFRE